MYTSSGITADEARSSIMIQLMFLIENIKARSWKDVDEEERPRLMKGYGFFSRKPKVHSEVINDKDFPNTNPSKESHIQTDSNVDNGFANAPCADDHNEQDD